MDEEESEEVLAQLQMIVGFYGSLLESNLMVLVEGEESLGMAMTFTIASAARESLGEVVRKRLKREHEAYERRAEEYEEVTFQPVLQVFLH